MTIRTVMAFLTLMTIVAWSATRDKNMLTWLTTLKVFNCCVFFPKQRVLLKIGRLIVGEFFNWLSYTAKYLEPSQSHILQIVVSYSELNDSFLNDC